MFQLLKHTLLILITMAGMLSACTEDVQERYGWKRIQKLNPLEVNLTSHSLQVRTKVVAGSHRKMRVIFYDQRGNDAGGLFVKFSNPPQYMIGYCSNWRVFESELPMGREKEWTIQREGERVFVDCNGDEVLSFTPSDEICDRWSDWKFYWKREVASVKFTKKIDRASRSYRAQPKLPDWQHVPRGHLFRLDLQNKPLEILSDVRVGSGAQIRLLFYDSNKMPAGGLFISLSSPPRYRMPFCVPWQEFDSWKDPKSFQSPLGQNIVTVGRSEHGVRLSYNQVEVLDFHLSDTTCAHGKDWEQFWNRSVDRVMFHPNLDTASHLCRVPPSTDHHPKLW